MEPFDENQKKNVKKLNKNRQTWKKFAKVDKRATRINKNLNKSIKLDKNREKIDKN